MSDPCLSSTYSEPASALERLLDLLARGGLEPRPEEMADALWLSAFIVSPLGQSKGREPQRDRTAADSASSDVLSSDNDGEDEQKKPPKQKETADLTRKAEAGEGAHVYPGGQGNRIRLLADTVGRNPPNAPSFAISCLVESRPCAKQP